MGRLSLKLAPYAQRWGNQAPAVCCGVCKPCVSQAALGAVVTAAGLSLEAWSARREAEGEAAQGPSAATDAPSPSETA